MVRENRVHVYVVSCVDYIVGVLFTMVLRISRAQDTFAVHLSIRWDDSTEN